MLKKIFLTSIVLIALLLGFLIAAPFIFKGKLVEIAKRELNSQLNAKVDFKDVGISIFKDFPNLTLSLKQLSIVNNAPFEGDTLAAIGSFSASVNIMSVIKGETVDVRGIFIEKPNIHVKVLKDGSANYDILKATAQAEKKETPPSEVKVQLNQLKISSGNITYSDRQSDMSGVFTGLNFNGKGDFSKDIFDFNTLTNIEKATVTSGAVSYLNNANMEMKLDLGVDMPNSKYTFKENSLRVNALLLGLDGWLSDKTKEQYEMDLKFSAKETSFKNLLSLVPAVYLKDFEKVKTSGSIALTGFAKGTYKGETYPAFGLAVRVDNAMFQYPGLPASVSDIFIDAKVDNPGGDLDKTVINAPKFNLKVGSEPVALKMLVKTPVSDPDLEVSAKGKLDLANVKQFYPLEAGEELAGKVDADAYMKGRMSALENEEYNKVDARGTVNIAGLKYKSSDLPEGVIADKVALVFASKKGSALSALPVSGYGTLEVQNLKYADKTLPGGKADISALHVTLNENDASLERLNAKIGRSDFSLSGKLDNLLGYLLSDGTLGGNLDLKSTLIDANEWLAAEPATSPGAPASSEQTAAEGSTVPANLALDLTANASKVLYDKVEMRNVAAKAAVKNETFTLQSIAADMLGGKAELSGMYSTKELIPKVNFNYNIQNIDIAQAVKTMSTAEKLAPVFNYMNGKFTAKGDMRGSLLSDLSLDMKSLLANGRVDLNNTTVTGMPVLNELADKFKIQQLKNISISDAWTVFDVKDGRVAVEPFDVKFNNIAMNISGSQGLDQSVDYDILMDLPKNLLGGANELVSGLLAKTPIPGFSAANLPELTKFKLKVTNTLLQPKISVNLLGGGGATIKEQITETVKEQVQQVKEEVSAKAKAEADKIIAEAKIQAQKIRDEGRKLADTVKKEGYAQAKKLEEQAKNPVAKIAAQEAAKKLRKESDDKAAKIIKEADGKAAKLEQEAQTKADQLLQKID